MPRGSEIQLRFPRKKVGVIIGKAGVNIKIIEGKSRAKVSWFRVEAKLGHGACLGVYGLGFRV